MKCAIQIYIKLPFLALLNGDQTTRNLAILVPLFPVRLHLNISCRLPMLNNQWQFLSSVYNGDYPISASVISAFTYKM